MVSGGDHCALSPPLIINSCSSIKCEFVWNYIGAIYLDVFPLHFAWKCGLFFYHRLPALHPGSSLLCTFLWNHASATPWQVGLKMLSGEKNEYEPMFILMHLVLSHQSAFLFHQAPPVSLFSKSLYFKIPMWIISHKSHNPLLVSSHWTSWMI